MSSPLKSPVIPTNNSALAASTKVLPGYSHAIKCLRKEELNIQTILHSSRNMCFFNLKKKDLLAGPCIHVMLRNMLLNLQKIMWGGSRLCWLSQAIPTIQCGISYKSPSRNSNTERNIRCFYHDALLRPAMTTLKILMSSSEIWSVGHYSQVFLSR